MTDPELLASFEARFRDDPDPWKFEASDYELAKRRETLRACGTLTGARVLELGAANGVLAADLAGHAAEVVAIEAVHQAARLATNRLADHARAHVVEGIIPRDVPAGPYDVIVASEILYCLNQDAYARTLQQLQDWLAPGGRIVAVHWRPDGPERPRTAATVHDDLAALPYLELVEAAEHEQYLLSVLRRRETDRQAWVVIPARNEAEHIAAAIQALTAAAAGVTASTHLVIVDDGSTDDTAAIVRNALGDWTHGTAIMLSGPSAGAGWARRTGLDHALTQAESAGDPSAIIATTDADSQVPEHWLTQLHALAGAGHEVIAGDITLSAEAHPGLVAARAERLATRLAAIREYDPQAQHPHFAGGNLAFTARTLTLPQPLPTPRALEDDALHARCDQLGLEILRDASFPVTTSPRLTGRAETGLATALARDARDLGVIPSDTRSHPS
ncbi:MAG: glycosyltransferase [Solirubrobacteraceae bacterium]|nr:glycosyltransferase [Patulibacter sp.]